MYYETIILEKKPKDGIAILTLNRPEVLNAMSRKLKEEVRQAADEIEKDESIRVLILTGAGRAFCAGQDLNETKKFSTEDGGGVSTRWVGKRYHETFGFFEKPLIAAMHGYACGAGFQLALSADIRIAAENAKMGMTEINVGLPCIYGAYILSRVTSPFVAREITLTGRFVEADRAEKLGIVNMVVPKEKLMDTAIELAKELAQKPAFAMKLQKKWLNEYFRRDYDYVHKRGMEIHAENFSSGEPQRIMKQFFADKSKRLTKK